MCVDTTTPSKRGSQGGVSQLEAVARFWTHNVGQYRRWAFYEILGRGRHSAVEVKWGV